MNWWTVLAFNFVLAAKFSEVSTRELSYYRIYNAVEMYCGPWRTFNPHTHTCCQGYIRPLLGPWYLNKCCGTLNYNRRFHWCCAGQLRRNYLNSATARPRCCGRSSYNPATQTCCDGVVTATKVPSYLPSACCGRNSYNPFKQTCCGGRVQNLVGGFRYTKCCGVRSINSRLQKCCNGVARSSSDPVNDQCCGTILLHRDEKCCEGSKAVVVSQWADCPNETVETI